MFIQESLAQTLQDTTQDMADPADHGQDCQQHEGRRAGVTLEPLCHDGIVHELDAEHPLEPGRSCQMEAQQHEHREQHPTHEEPREGQDRGAKRALLFAEHDVRSPHDSEATELQQHLEQRPDGRDRALARRPQGMTDDRPDEGRRETA
jgi:hypothetical protein